MNLMRAEAIIPWKHPAEMLSLFKKPLLNIRYRMVNYSLYYRKKFIQLHSVWFVLQSQLVMGETIEILAVMKITGNHLQIPGHGLATCCQTS